MRLHPTGICVAAVAIFLCAGSAAMAQGTERERQACTPDVFRLCGAYIPDVDRITACLRGNGPRLSQACYNVLFPPSPPPQQQYQPQYDPRRRYYPAPRPGPDDDED